jgi:archaellum component FlaC
MTTITIDNKEYEFESLSDKAKGQLSSIQYIDSELARLQAQASVLQTARAAYSKVLNEELNPLGSGDTIKF